MQDITSEGEIVTPSKIVCVGRNYVAHIEELGNDLPDDMVVFNKPNSAISRVLHSHHIVWEVVPQFHTHLRAHQFACLFKPFGLNL